MYRLQRDKKTKFNLHISPAVTKTEAWQTCYQIILILFLVLRGLALQSEVFEVNGIKKEKKEKKTIHLKSPARVPKIFKGVLSLRPPSKHS